MGLGGKSWLKQLLRSDERLKHCMHYASYSRARSEERTKKSGKGEETKFDVAIVELMLAIHRLVKGCQNLRGFADKWRNEVAIQIARFPDAETIIFLFDDETNVPQSKSATQAKRRAKPEDRLTPYELSVLGNKYQRLCNSNHHEFDALVNQLFGAKARETNASSAFEVFLNKYLKTPGTREDLVEFATRCITSGPYGLLHTKTNDGVRNKRIIIDRGVWRRSFRRDIKTDVRNGNSETWEDVVRSFRTNEDKQKQLTPSPCPSSGGGVYSLISKIDAPDDDVNNSNNNNDDDDDDDDEPYRAWILMDKFGVRSIDAMNDQHIVGEADVKIAKYARVFAGQNIFIVCHDTDEIPILLMTVKDWIPRKGVCFGRLWLDITIPSYDENPKRPRRKRRKKDEDEDDEDDKKPLDPLPGVIDIIELWRLIHHWFLEEYPDVRNPVEVFCMLLVLMGTDFLKNPPQLGPERLWKAFQIPEVREFLSESVITDGHLGAALPHTTFEQQLVDGTLFNKVTSAQESLNYTLALLLRDTTSGTFYHKKQEQHGLNHCPEGRQERHISFKEAPLVKFLTQAYVNVLPKKVDTRPNKQWMLAEIRRVEWNMAYWYIGDTGHGRYFTDDMALAENGNSIFGWTWVADNNDNSTATATTTTVITASESKVVEKKRKAGCLGRTRPYRHISQPSKIVASVEELRQFQQTIMESRKNKKQKTTTTVVTSYTQK